MNQKGFTNIVLILAIVVLAGAGGYFVLFRTSRPGVQKSQPSVTNIPLPHTPNATDNFFILGSVITLKGTANKINTGAYLFSVLPKKSGERLLVYRNPNCTITLTHSNGETNCDVGTNFIELVDGNAKLSTVLGDNVKEVEVQGTLQENKKTTVTGPGSFPVYIIVDSIKEL